MEAWNLSDTFITMRLRNTETNVIQPLEPTTEPRQAEEIIATGKADAVLLAREFLRDPYWPQRAAAEGRLGLMAVGWVERKR